MTTVKYIRGDTIPNRHSVLCQVIDGWWVNGDRGNIFNPKEIRRSAIEDRDTSAMDSREMLHEVEGFEEFYYDDEHRYFIFKFGDDRDIRYRTYVVFDDAEFFRC
jgi:hypothetical protein